MRILLSALIFLAPLTGWSTPIQTTTPISVGIYPPVQFPADNFVVKGLRMSLLMGRSKGVYGIDLGLLGNMTDQYFGGLALAGIFNYNADTATVYGAQLAGITNINRGSSRVYGVQAALAANLADYTDIYGVQLGLYNRARVVYGLQIGLVNVASALYGIQIGLANFNEGGPFGVSPIINIGF